MPILNLTIQQPTTTTTNKLQKYNNNNNNNSQQRQPTTTTKNNSNNNNSITNEPLLMCNKLAISFCMLQIQTLQYSVCARSFACAFVCVLFVCVYVDLCVRFVGIQGKMEVVFEVIEVKNGC